MAQFLVDLLQIIEAYEEKNAALPFARRYMFSNNFLVILLGDSFANLMPER